MTSAGDGRGNGGGPEEFGSGALRPYVITRGRARPSRNTIGVETLLRATCAPEDLPVTATRESVALVRMCRRVLSLVEAAAYLEMPVSVVAVVASDLVDSGHLSACSGIPPAGVPDRTTLQEVLDALRRL